MTNTEIIELYEEQVQKLLEYWKLITNVYNGEKIHGMTYKMALKNGFDPKFLKIMKNFHYISYTTARNSKYYNTNIWLSTYATQRYDKYLQYTMEELEKEYKKMKKDKSKCSKILEKMQNAEFYSQLSSEIEKSFI